MMNELWNKDTSSLSNSELQAHINAIFASVWDYNWNLLIKGEGNQHYMFHSTMNSVEDARYITVSEFSKRLDQKTKLKISIPNEKRYYTIDTSRTNTVCMSDGSSTAHSWDSSQFLDFAKNPDIVLTNTTNDKDCNALKPNFRELVAILDRLDMLKRDTRSDDPTSLLHKTVKHTLPAQMHQLHTDTKNNIDPSDAVFGCDAPTGCYYMNKEAQYHEKDAEAKYTKSWAETWEHEFMLFSDNYQVQNVPETQYLVIYDLLPRTLVIDLSTPNDLNNQSKTKTPPMKVKFHGDLSLLPKFYNALRLTNMEYYSDEKLTEFKQIFDEAYDSIAKTKNISLVL